MRMSRRTCLRIAAMQRPGPRRRDAGGSTRCHESTDSQHRPAIRGRRPVAGRADPTRATRTVQAASPDARALTRSARLYAIRRTDRCVQPAPPPSDPRRPAKVLRRGRSEGWCGGTCAGRGTWRLPHEWRTNLLNVPAGCQGLDNKKMIRMVPARRPSDIDPTSPDRARPPTSVGALARPCQGRRAGRACAREPIRRAAPRRAIARLAARRPTAFSASSASGPSPASRCPRSAGPRRPRAPRRRRSASRPS